MADRSHLSIGEVLSLLRDEFPDVTISKIRFLESQGLVDPERTPSGYRKFYEHDVERLRWILRQQREHFLPLKVIRGRLSEQAQGADPDAPAGDDRGGPAPEPAADRASEPAWVPAAPAGGDAVGGTPRGAAPAGGAGGTPRLPATPSLFAGLHGGTEPAAGPQPAGPQPAVPQAAGPHGPGQQGPGAGNTQHPGAPDHPGSGAHAGPDDRRPAPGAGAVVPGPGVGTPPATGGRAVAPGHPLAAAPARSAGTPRGIAAAVPVPAPGGVAGASEESDTYTAEELAAAAGAELSLVNDLKQYGLIAPHGVVAGTPYYDASSVAVTRAAADFARHGVEARHLRIWRNAADREADLFQQVVLPLLRQRNPQARQQAADTLADLARAGSQLRAALVERVLREIR